MEGQLDKVKTKLTVTLVNFYLSNGKTQTQISKLCNVSPQAVNSFISSHREELAFLKSPKELLKDSSAIIAFKAGRNLSKVLDLEPDKKDLVALNMISGTHIDKYLNLSGQGVSNDVHAILIGVFDRRQQPQDVIYKVDNSAIEVVNDSSDKE